MMSARGIVLLFYLLAIPIVMVGIEGYMHLRRRSWWKAIQWIALGVPFVAALSVLIGTF
jgi:hypothetical protein